MTMSKNGHVYILGEPFVSLKPLRAVKPCVCHPVGFHALDLYTYPNAGF